MARRPVRRRLQKSSQRPQSAAGRPLVAIVGRPNVGKSALFNRLTGTRLAIVEDVPGVTRDRLYADGLAFGHEYVLVDTGGFDPDSDDPMTQSIAAQIEVALAEADVVIALFDGTQPPMQADREALGLLRASGLPVLYAANKIDNPGRGLEAMELYSLGIDQLHVISALHGHGIGDLEEALVPLLPAPSEEAEDPALDDVPRIAIVGRPNAGKSSLLNRLLGEARQIVDDRPGTTVDSVDALYEDEDGPLVLIDTAGIRRKRSVDRGVEGLAVLQAIRAVERSHTVVLMIDARAGVSEQDAKIAGLALDRGRALVIALNKSDLLDADERKRAFERTEDVLSFVPWATLKAISARTGRGVRGLLTAAREATESHRKRIATSEVNRFFEEVIETHPPPTSGGRAVRFYYVTQATSAPPTFVIQTNFPDRVHFSYQGYVVNQLRKRFGFSGTPVRVRYRGRNKKKR